MTAVRGGAAEGGEEKHGDLSRERDEAEKGGGLRQPIDEPRLSDLLHPRAGERDELTAEEELVVAVTKRAGEVCHSVGVRHEPDVIQGTASAGRHCRARP